MKTKTKAIRRLNDDFRTGKTDNSYVTVTAGIHGLGEDVKATIFLAVRMFDDFTEENDPYGEHDFGSFTYQSHKVFWKIDYYNRDLSGGSEDPSDPAVTSRVLTIMLAEEY